jgi:GT2 family glycosyltransferase
MSTLDIIIVSYNCRDALEGCLRSLEGAPERARCTVTVVDNGSTDGTRERLHTAWTSVRVIEAENRGFAAGNNLGIRATGSPLVLLLNPDTVVPAGAIDTLVSSLEQDRQAAVAGPRLVDVNERAELSFGSMIGPLAEVRQKVLVRGSDREWPVVSAVVDRMTKRRRYVDWVSGACLLIRRDVLTAVGLLDERFFLYTEDVDLCAAVRARGDRVLFAPEATIVHLRGRSRASAVSASQMAYRRSHLAFYEKHHPNWAPLLKVYLRLRGQFPHDW